jgi:hypothetical protein
VTNEEAIRLIQEQVRKNMGVDRDRQFFNAIYSTPAEKMQRDRDYWQGIYGGTINNPYTTIREETLGQGRWEDIYREPRVYANSRRGEPDNPFSIEADGTIILHPSQWSVVA